MHTKIKSKNSNQKEQKMINIEKIKLDIVEKLKPLNPYQIILFGSYTYGSPTKDSDIDLTRSHFPSGNA